MNPPETTPKVPTILIGTHVDKATHQRIRVLAAQHGVSMAQWLKQTINAAMPTKAQDDQHVS